jgi:hypothetical protein
MRGDLVPAEYDARNQAFARQTWCERCDTLERIFGGLDFSVTSAAIDWLTPAERMPWPVVAPFRMRPNLEKLDADAPALLLRDDLADVYRRERAKVLATHPERALVGRAGASVLECIQDLASARHACGSGGSRAKRSFAASAVPTNSCANGDRAARRLRHPKPRSRHTPHRISLSLLSFTVGPT